jgi:hypothetical protein
LIERTAKPIKLAMLVSGLAACVGVWFLCAGQPAVGFFLAVGGFVALLLFRVFAWWEHG